MLAMQQQDIAARLGRALIVLRGNTPQQQLADALQGKIVGQRVTQNWVSRRERGEVELTPTEVAVIEQALGARHGSVYWLAGLIEGDADPQETWTWTSARRAIENDPLLTESLRRVVLGAYDGAVAVNSSAGAVEDGHERS